MLGATPAGRRVLAAFDDVGTSSLTMTQIEVRARIRPPHSHAAVGKLIADGHLSVRSDHGGALYARIQPEQAST